MGFFPPVLWIMLRQPDLTMLASILLWLVARYFGWNFQAYPAGTWYFNPYCWQVLFVFGSWCALGGPRRSMSIINSPFTLYLCIAYLIFALVMTMAGKFPDFGALFPHWLYSTFNPNDKTFLGPYRFLHFVVIVILTICSPFSSHKKPVMARCRFLHFVVIVILTIRFVPKDWPGLEWKVFDPLVG